MRLIDCEQQTPEWYAARLGIPTASCFDKIITPKTGKLSAQADGYIDHLIDEIVRPEAERGFGGNWHTERGNELEPEARDLYALIHDVTLRQVGLVLSDCGRMGCSPDALVNSDGGLEAKAPDGPTHVGYLRGGILPAKYRTQVHGSLVVTGRDWWDFISYCPGYRPLIVRTYPDDFTKQVASAMSEFLDRLDAAKAQFIEPEEIAA